MKSIKKITSSVPNSKRGKNLAYGISTGILIKATSFIITIITVPMTLEYLGPERYGVWVTIISILAWISLVDIGIANGLVPLLTDAISKKNPELARKFITTAFWNLILISIIIITGLSIAWDYLNWGEIFNTNSKSLQSEIKYSTSIAIAIFAINLPLSITQKIYLANQDGASLNKWLLLSSLSSFIGIYLATKTDGGIMSLVIGYSGSQLLITSINTVWLYWRYKPELRPDRKPDFFDTKKVMAMGGMFFINQIATLVVFQKDNILITHLIGPLQATQFSVAWQMFFYINTLNLLIAPYLGPAFGDAYATKDYQWMRKSAIRYLTASISFTTIFVIILSIFYKEILSIWIPSYAPPSQNAILWMAAWAILLSIQWPIISLLNSTGQLRNFTFFYSLAALLNIFLSVFLIKRVGFHGGLIASITSVTLLSLGPSIRELLNIINTDKNYAKK